MRMVARLGAVFGAAFVLAVPLACRAADEATDTSKLYDVEMKATPKVKQGADGAVQVRIVPKNGGEIHKEAPITLTLEGGEQLAMSKQKVGRPELKMDGHDASFDVPFTAKAAGAANVDAKLTFFICTEKLCARQERKAKLPVSVE